MSSKKCFFTTLEKVERYSDPAIEKIAIGTVDGNKTVVSINSKPGDTGILFYPDCILSEAFMEQNSLKSSSFSKGRVRVARFKGEWSECLFIPKTKAEVEKLFEKEIPSDGFLEPKEGVYSVYVVPIRASTQKSGVAKIEPNRSYPQFPMHVDTEQYRSYVREIEKLYKDGWELSVSLKTHGSSGRTGHVQVPKTPSLLERAKIKVMELLKRNTSQYKKELEQKYYNTSGEWKILNGTRRVILKDEPQDLFHPIEFRDKTSYFKDTLEKGTVVYYEILGWEDINKPIMSPNNGVPYAYGLPNGEFAIQVYRVTRYNRDLPVEEMEKYCREVINLSPVQRMERVFGIERGDSFESVKEIIAQLFEDSATNKVLTYVDELCENQVLYYSHINEGIVVRLDAPAYLTHGSKFFKLKRPEFYEAEGLIKAADLARVSLEQE